MQGLELTKGNQRRIFTATRDVVVMEGGTPVVRGQWKCAPVLDGRPRVNALAYTFDGADADDVPVRWSFNDRNQLVGVIPAMANGGADSAPFAFAGKIKVDDNRDIAYELLDAAGAATGFDITVLGELSFNEKDNALEIRFQDGGQPARITGDSGLGSLSTGMYAFDDFAGSDFLRFQASTINEMPDGNVIVSPASIEWIGNWDLQANRLVFAAQMKTAAGGAPTINVVLAGKTKAVAGGLAYFSGPDGKQLALEISGMHRWDGAEAKWDVSLGFTEKKLTAKVSGEVVVERRTGERFALKGNLAFAQADDATTIEMDIEAFYQWAPGGIVRFNAAVSMSNGTLNYNLQLEGQFEYDGKRLTFRIQFTRDATGSDKLIIELGLRTDSDFFAKILIVLNPADPSNVNLQLSFQVRMKWINGVPVKEVPVIGVSRAPQPEHA